LAVEFGLDLSTVTRRLHGVPPSKIRLTNGGRTDKKWYMTDAAPALLPLPIADTDDDPTTLTSERLRLLSEQADREALENAVRRGEVIDFEDALEVVASIALLVASRLDGVGGGLANELINEPNPAKIRKKLLSEHRAICEALVGEAHKFEEQTAALIANIENEATRQH
jgi:hypothetical protein